MFPVVDVVEFVFCVPVLTTLDHSNFLISVLGVSVSACCLMTCFSI